jgi:F-type H+-transporting ATPase subunit b
MEKLISEFSFGLFFWQLLIFVGLIFLLKKYAWKPILDAVNDRETSIKDALHAADAARKEIEALKEDNQKIFKEARAEREAMLKEARKASTEMIDKAKKEANHEAEKILTQAQEAIENEKRAAINVLKNQVANIAMDIAEKVVEKELDDKDQQLKLVGQLLKEANLK